MHPLLGKIVAVMGANYIYTGELLSVTMDTVVIKDPRLIYETGLWTDKQWKDAQKMPTDAMYIERSGIEGMFEVKK